LNIAPFTYSKETEIIHFAQAHPWKPQWTQDYIEDFMRRLISRPDLVFDLFLENKRVATAVLIDKIQNKGNNACLEFLGVNPQQDLSQIYKLVLQAAKNRLPRQRSGIEITLCDDFKFLAGLIVSEGFFPYFDTFEMISETKSSPAALEIEELCQTDFPECYKVLEESFKENPDIASPGFEAWKLSRLEAKNSIAWVYKDHGKIIGYLNLSINREYGEIKSVGVLPDQRGKGIGRQLISYMLNYLYHNQIPYCHLTVATQNLNALQLYKKLGFRVESHYQVFQWHRPHAFNGQ
jgi:ribosomal protein S18 acetylase RimI-like enzyme